MNDRLDVFRAIHGAHVEASLLLERNLHQNVASIDKGRPQHVTNTHETGRRSLTRTAGGGCSNRNTSRPKTILTKKLP
ncbi:hypothetical protein J6590_034070 [Homalodisca vitripennis]|nr:hypothetical protein J6590_034070 [Homalodisca vitripennis]